MRIWTGLVLVLAIGLTGGLMGGLKAGMASAADGVSYASGGIVRLPNSQQFSDRDNAMLEGWAKASLPLRRLGSAELGFFVRGKYLSDTAGYAFNRSQTGGIGLALKLKPGKKSSLTFSLRHDWYKRRGTPILREGTRFLVDYFFLDYKSAQRGDKMLGLRKTARVFKVFANFTYPDTLAKGDHNKVSSGGGEVSWNLALPDTKLYLSPFLSLSLSWDSDENSYNNKAQPGAGIKARWPVSGGDVHVGLRYRGDYRWVSDTFRHGPELFVGWYASF